MPRIRTRRDGVRELKVDDEVHEIPHDHELAPNPTFSYAYREAFFVHPLYMSVSRSDMACADAFVALAAAHDLTVMGQRLGQDLKQLLDPAIQKLRDVALASTSAATVKHLQERLTELSTPKIEASRGPEFGDDVWYAGTGKTEDDEIERNLEAPFDGADVYDDVYTESENRCDSIDKGK
jgi:hypothetical protein